MLGAQPEVVAPHAARRVCQRLCPVRGSGAFSHFNEPPATLLHPRFSKRKANDTRIRVGWQGLPWVKSMVNGLFISDPASPSDRLPGADIRKAKQAVLALPRISQLPEISGSGISAIVLWGIFLPRMYPVSLKILFCLYDTYL